MTALDLTHAGLIRRAVRWLQRTKNCAVVFSEVANVTAEIPDAIGWQASGSHVVECKASRSDFLRDRAKPHMRDEASGMGRQRWYLVPPGVAAETDVPSWCGLIVCKPRTIEIVKPAPWRDRWDVRHENTILVSALRRHSFGALVSESGRFETMRDRQKRQEAEGLTSPYEVIW